MNLVRVPGVWRNQDLLRDRRMRFSMQETTRGPLRLAMAGGGTGGHIVPGLNLLGHMRGTRALADLLWFQSGRAVEAQSLAGLDERLQPTPVERVTLTLEPAGGGAPSNKDLLRRLLPEVRRARRALSKHRTQVLLGLGGFTALPPVLAAASLRIPVGLLEINATQGRGTRWLAPFAKRVFHAWRTSLPQTEGAARNQGGRHYWTGPPLSTSFLETEVSEQEERAARAELGFDPARPLLVVLGGSQGAQALNRFMRTYLHTLLDAQVQVLHQTGPGRGDEAAAHAPGYHPVEYVTEMRQALVAATVVLCRGGASTVAEVGALEKPAWFVPYPHHPDRHQEKNARQLGPGARIVHESELADHHAHDLAELCNASGAGTRRTMSKALRGLVPCDSAVRLFEELLAMRRD